MGDGRANGGTRVTFDTKQQAEAYERNPQFGNVKPLVGPLFRHGYDYLWASTKNSKGQWSHVVQLIDFLGETTPVAVINSMTVQDVIIRLQKEKNQGGTINKKMVTFRMLLEHCKTRGALTELPTFRRFDENGGRERYLTHDEAKAMLSKIDMPEYQSFFMFLLWTGARVGEAQAVQWHHIRNDKVTFHWSTTKGAKTRTLPLSICAKQAIDYAATRYGNLTGPWSGIDYDTFHEVFTRAKKLAGMGHDDEVVPHTLRHTCASWMVQDGVGIEVVQKWLGHSTITTTMRYAHLAPNAFELASLTLNSHADRYPLVLPKSDTNCHRSDEGSATENANHSRFQSLKLVGECPERQRGRTVNPLAMPSQVRVLLPPPLPLSTGSKRWKLLSGGAYSNCA